MRRAYAFLVLCLAPVMAALWGWPAGAVAMAVALVLGRFPAILAALPRNRRRERLGRLQAQWKAGK